MNQEPKALRLLIADDELSVRDAIKMMLEFYNYEVVAVDGGEQAIKSLENGRFDLVITDFSMRKMKGNELAERIKERWPEQPILMITAHAETLMPSDLMNVDGVLSKPFALHELREAIVKLSTRSK